MLAASWIGWGRGAWNRYQIRTLLRGALEAVGEGNEEKAKELLRRAGERATLSTLRPGPERDLYRAILVREAYEEQLRREPQEVRIVARGMSRDFLALRNEGRRLRLPCPAVVEFMAVLVGRGLLD